MRIIPPSQVSNLATHLDQCVFNATCALVGVEDIPQFQIELLTTPANNGGWSLPALGLIKECAYIGGAAATPRTPSWEIPPKYPQNFVERRIKEVETATTSVSDTLGYTCARRQTFRQRNTREEASKTGTPQTLTRLVKARRTQLMRGGG